ncbi:MAG: MoaD/ThiS family protein [Ginsengibacter sp.]
MAFGIVKDIFKGPSVNVEVNNTLNVEGLKLVLEEKFRELKSLASYMVAVNNEYAMPKDSIQPNDDVAIIPPVSGG